MHKTLYKLVSHVQMGHLYEHILFNGLTNALRQEGIFEYVDYDIDAKTFYKGFVRLDVNTYTKRGERAIELLSSISIEFSDDEVSIGLLQILAEKHVDVRVYNDAAVKKNLKQIHEQPWLELLDTERLENDMKLTTRYMNFTDRHTRNFGRLTQRIAVPKGFIDTHAELLPLYVVVSKALRINLQSAITSSSFCYSVEDIFKSGSNVEDINIYMLDKRQATELSEEVETTRDLLTTMAKHGFVERLSDFLLNANMDSPSQFPNDEEILKKTGVVVGIEYWKRMGTVANIMQLLQAITISYTIGKDTDSLVIRDQGIL